MEIEVTPVCETVTTNQTARRHIPEDYNLNPKVSPLWKLQTPHSVSVSVHPMVR